MLVVELFRKIFERGEPVDTGVVDQNIETTEDLLRLGKQALNVFFFRHIGLHGHGLSAIGFDFRNHALRAFLTGSVVDDNSRSFRRQMFGYACADPFGSAGNQRNLTCKFFGHDDNLSCRAITLYRTLKMCQHGVKLQELFTAKYKYSCGAVKIYAEKACRRELKRMIQTALADRARKNCCIR